MTGGKPAMDESSIAQKMLVSTAQMAVTAY
jgi:hypothetical protein